MKPLKIIFPLLLTALLTACVSQTKLNIDELLKKYNDISASELTYSMFTVTEYNDNFVYKRIVDNALLCFYAADDGEIVQCTVTVKKDSERNFKSVCLSVIEAFTGFSNEKSEKLFDEKGISEKYKLTVNDYNIGKTMILNKADSELNTNELPTLKREVKEEDIARPTLSDKDNSTNAIRQ